jgi:Ca2+-binding RTX toxin-like protein
MCAAFWGGLVAIAGIAAAPPASGASLKHGELAINGTPGDDTIAIRLQAGAPGVLQVDLGDDGTPDFTFAIADVQKITVDGGDGDDSVRLDDANGPVSIPAKLDGGAGANTLTAGGSPAANQIELSTAGKNLQLARDSVSTVASQFQQVGIDLGAGDGAADGVTVDGTSAADSIAVTPAAGGLAVSGLPYALTVTGVEPSDLLDVSGLNGNDTLDASTLAATSVELTLDGGAGNDVLKGGSGDDTLLGGDGKDTVDGNRGADLAQLGAGDDTFVWDPGDGSDVVEGDAGNDTMLFNGAAIGEQMSLSANGTRLTFFRNVGGITMDTNNVEQVTVNAAGGADTLTVDDLTGTDVSKVNLDLGAADGAADQVIVNGTGAADAIKVDGGNGSATVTGLAATVNVADAEPANDTLTINSLAGADTVDASGLAGSSLKLALNGGDDADTLTGSAGSDVIDGNRGNDQAFMGPGDDTFTWFPGDGNDSVDGGDGNDTLHFVGAAVAEQMELSANGSRLRLTRSIAGITMDANNVEQVTVDAQGGADTLTVDDLTGTGVTNVNLDLGNADGAADQVVVNGTNASDTIAVSGAGGSATVLGLAAQVNVTGSEPANDSLTVKANDGDDVVDATALAATTAKLTIDGGIGADVLLGSAGDDVIFGGPGDDVLIGGPGQDTLDGGPGSNIVIQ